jgi:8-oxo-dGTP diphosphatase
MTSSFKPVTPLLTVDIVIEMGESESPTIVLIERKNPPYGWALPGGFVDVGETVENAAIREAKEETNLDVTLTELLGIYSDPKRDTRGHTVSAVFIAKINSTSTAEAKAQDDAKNLQICDPNSPPGQLAFDHKKIIDDYLQFKATGERPKPICNQTVL